MGDKSEVKALKKKGFRVSSKQVKVGKGWTDYRKAKRKLNNWE